jgi:hypothetical protein
MIELGQYEQALTSVRAALVAPESPAGQPSDDQSELLAEAQTLEADALWGSDAGQRPSTQRSAPWQRDTASWPDHRNRRESPTRSLSSSFIG